MRRVVVLLSRIGEGKGRGEEGKVSLMVQSSDASKKTMLAFSSSCHGRFFISASFTLFVPIKNRVKFVWILKKHGSILTL